MDSNEIKKGIIRAVAYIIGIALLLLFIYKIQSVILYIIIAAIISLIGLPIVKFLKTKLKFNNTLAVIIAMTTIIGLLSSLIGLLIPLVVEQGQNLSLLNIKELESSVESLYQKVIHYLSDKDIDVDKSLTTSNLFSKIDYSIIPNFLNAIIGGFGSFSIALFSIIFISFFLLIDSKLLEQGILTFVTDRNEDGTKRSLNEIKNLLSRYFVGLVLQISILFVIYTAILLTFGVNNAVVIAFLCALLNLIPFIGPMIGLVLMVFLTMTSFIGSDFQTVILPKTIFVMIGFLIGQLVDNFFSQPIIFSKSVKSHPLEIFLVISIAGILFGIVGLIVAIPLYTSIKVILKEFLSNNDIVKKLTKNL
ncbi:MAG: AI-2E family transporter [Flavobacteriaceae bacterium]|jgi:predicted PurR-regulated permease PerM|nr:AI-2E family transporter [Flavobacteriaceae bacterium]MBT3920896.1 AI-2E family transporter [Flavobacteriaceae bacterium]MBT6705456.1 AI-2E family transporter [Flavobacteriaceae bacterium]